MVLEALLEALLETLLEAVFEVIGALSREKEEDAKALKQADVREFRARDFCPSIKPNYGIPVFPTASRNFAQEQRMRGAMIYFT